MDINSYRSKGQVSARELVSLEKISPNDIAEFLVTARDLKLKCRFGEKIEKVAGKNVFLISKNSYGKSRIAFEIAVRSLFANPISLPLDGNHLEELMTTPENIKVIERFGVSCLVCDTEQESDSITLTRNLSVPVIDANDRSGTIHALAILLTLWEKKGRLENLNAVIIGDPCGDKMALVYAMAKCGLNITLVSPTETEAVLKAIDFAKQFTLIHHSKSLDQAIKNCDFVFTYENDYGSAYKLTLENLKFLAPNALYSQNIPLERDKYADNALIDSPKSCIFEQGENIMHLERAAIYLLAK